MSHWAVSTVSSSSISDGNEGLFSADRHDINGEDCDDFYFDYDYEFDFSDDCPWESPSPSEEDPAQDSPPTARIRKKRIRNRRRIFAPRIIKRDYRRHYATMMANMFNSYDTAAYAAFFTTFAAPNMRVRKEAAFDLPASQEFQDSFRPSTVENDVDNGGTDWSVMHFSVMKSLFPDMTMRVESAVLRSRSDTSKTLLTVKARIAYTRMHDVSPLLVTEDMFESTRAPAEPTETTTTTTTTATATSPKDTTPSSSRAVLREIATRADAHEYYKKKIGTDMPMLQEPQEVSFIGTVNFYFDELRRIEMLEIHPHASSSFVTEPGRRKRASDGDDSEARRRRVEETSSLGNDRVDAPPENAVMEEPARVMAAQP